MTISSSKLKVSPPRIPVRRWVPKSENTVAKTLYFLAKVWDHVTVASREISLPVRSTLMNEAETVALSSSIVLPIAP